jgi:hypothetical protein
VATIDAVLRCDYQTLKASEIDTLFRDPAHVLFNDDSGGNLTISDPIGPTLADPTLTPVHTSPSRSGVYTYHNGVASVVPYWLGAFQ